MKNLSKIKQKPFIIIANPDGGFSVSYRNPKWKGGEVYHSEYVQNLLAKIEDLERTIWYLETYSV